MNRDSKSIYSNYELLREQQQVVQIGSETINLPSLINAVDKSDLDLKIKNQLKSVLITKVAGSQKAPMSAPSAMTGGGQPAPVPPPAQNAPLSMF